MTQIEATKKYFSIIAEFGSQLKDLKQRKDDNKLSKSKVLMLVNEVEERHEKNLHLFIKELIKELPHKKE